MILLENMISEYNGWLANWSVGWSRFLSFLIALFFQEKNFYHPFNCNDFVRCF